MVERQLPKVHMVLIINDLWKLKVNKWDKKEH